MSIPEITMKTCVCGVDLEALEASGKLGHVCAGQSPDSVYIASSDGDSGRPLHAYWTEEGGDFHNWVRLDEGARGAPNASDQGWRLRANYETGEDHFELTEEQVFPERVLRPAAHVRCTRIGVRMNLAEARWLRDRLVQDIIPMLESQGEVVDADEDEA